MNAVAKVTDDFVYGGAIAVVMELFEEPKTFNVCKLIINGKFFFNGCQIDQDANWSIPMSM